MNRRGIRRLRAYGQQTVLRLDAGWDIFKDGCFNYYNSGAFNQAAAIALYALLSMIPLFVLSVLAASRFLGANPDIQSQITALIKSFHPYFTGGLVAQLGQVEEKSQVLGWLGFVSLIWFSSMIFGALETALNLTFRAESHRNLLTSKLLAFAMIPLGWVVGLSSVLLTYVSTLISAQGRHFLDLDILTRYFLQYVVPFLASVTFITVVFKVIPSRKIKLATALAGSCLFTLLTEMVKHPFTWYIANHTRYNEIFGSLVTVVILVIWVFYMALIFLFCAELMSSYERRDMLLIEHMLLSRKSRTGRQRLFRKFGRAFRADTIICREGDLSQEMFLILAGKVRLEMKTGPTAKILSELGPGDHFGEMAALTGSPRAATAIALSDCEIAVIDGHVFHHLLRESDDLSIHLLKRSSERIRNTNTALDQLSQAWTRMTILLLILRSWSPDAPSKLVPILAERTGQDPLDILEILKDLASKGALELEEAGISSLHRERAWELVYQLTDQKTPSTSLP